MIEVGYAPPEAREEVALFMQDVFPRAKWSLDGWRRLLVGRWSTPDAPYAITVHDGGRLIGVLGLILADRPTRDGPRRCVNMTSWYLQKVYRGRGIGREMLALTTADPDVTVTDLTSSRGAAPVVEAAGFAVLDRERLIWRPSGVLGPVLPVHDDPLSGGVHIDVVTRQLLEDHAGLNLVTRAVETPDGVCVLVLSVKQKHDDYVTHEVFYASDQDLFARHARSIVDSLLPPQGAVLSIDRRLVPGPVIADRVEALPVPRYYTPGRLRPDQVDPLYSEVVLLDMKLD